MNGSKLQYQAKYHNQLRTFLRILEEYPQDTQLAHFLPDFFRANKQMGSSDRRNASGLLYNYFRLGSALMDLPREERLAIAQFLCTPGHDAMAEYLRPELAQNAEWPLSSKIDLIKELHPAFRLEDVYPLHDHLSESIDKPAFLQSLFVQPDLFIRVHPGKEDVVMSKLRDYKVDFNLLDNNCISMANGTKLEPIFRENAPSRPYEVQDLSSQKTADYFKPGKKDSWWDACAASGGKSLLLHHQSPEVKLLVSDIRENILANLKERFKNAGLHKYHSKVIDLNHNADPLLHGFSFDGIILDAPCSGSGTWGRSPELIAQFRESSILKFQSLQRRIAANAVKYLKQGKPLVYITCSAFKEENEENIAFFEKELGLVPESAEVLKGYEEKADTMFVSRLIKV